MALCRRSVVSVALFLMLSSSAAAQKNAFVESVIALYTALAGDYGDEGPQAVAALDRMNAALSRLERGRPAAPIIPDSLSPVPAFAPAAYAEGFEGIANGRFRDAFEQLRGALAQDPLIVDPASRHPRVIAGTAALRKGQGAEAVKELEAAVTQLRDSAEAHRMLAAAYRLVGNGPARIEQLEAAVQLAPRDERARVALGLALAEAGRLPQAQQSLRETIDLLPTSGAARWALAGIHERVSNGDDARALLSDAARLPVLAGKSALYLRVAMLANRHQDFEEVIQALSERARLLPDAADAHKDLGDAYTKVGRDEDALAELLKATTLGVADAATFTTIGLIHLNAGRLEAAERVLRRAIATDPRHAQARYVLGNTLVRMGKANEGKQQLDEFYRLRTSEHEAQRREFEEATARGAGPT